MGSEDFSPLLHNSDGSLVFPVVIRGGLLLSGVGVLIEVFLLTDVYIEVSTAPNLSGLCHVARMCNP